MSGSMFGLKLLAGLLGAGLILFFIGRMIAQFIQIASSRPDEESSGKFDPLRTHLSFLEVVALVIPLIAFLVGFTIPVFVLFAVFTDATDNSVISNWAILMTLVATLCLSKVAQMLGEVLSKKILRRAGSPLAEKNDCN